MHLDCICSVLHDRLVLVDETILTEPRSHRYVDEYCITKNGYKLNEQRVNVEFK